MEPSSANAKQREQAKSRRRCTHTSKKQHGLRQRPGDIFRGKKNRRADNPADQQQHRIEQAESPNERGLSDFGSGSMVGNAG